jgi:hypothetical protein
MTPTKVEITSKPLSFATLVFVILFLTSCIRACSEDISVDEAMGRLVGESIVSVERGIQYARVEYAKEDSARQITKE